MESRRLGRYLNFKGKNRCLRHFGSFWMSGCGSSKGCSSGEETLEIYRQNSGTKVGVSVSSLGWLPLTTDVHWPVGHSLHHNEPTTFICGRKKPFYGWIFCFGKCQNSLGNDGGEAWKTSGTSQKKCWVRKRPNAGNELTTNYKWTVSKNPGSLLYVGDYTTQLHRDYNKPLSL